MVSSGRRKKSYFCMYFQPKNWWKNPLNLWRLQRILVTQKLSSKNLKNSKNVFNDNFWKRTARISNKTDLEFMFYRENNPTNNSGTHFLKTFCRFKGTVCKSLTSLTLPYKRKDFWISLMLKAIYSREVILIHKFVSQQNYKTDFNHWLKKNQRLIRFEYWVVLEPRLLYRINYLLHLERSKDSPKDQKTKRPKDQKIHGKESAPEKVTLELLLYSCARESPNACVAQEY